MLTIEMIEMYAAIQGYTSQISSWSDGTTYGADIGFSERMEPFGMFSVVVLFHTWLAAVHSAGSSMGGI